MGILAPPGTVTSNGNAPRVPTIRSPSKAATVRSSGTRSSNHAGGKLSSSRSSPNPAKMASRKGDRLVCGDRASRDVHGENPTGRPESNPGRRYAGQGATPEELTHGTGTHRRPDSSAAHRLRRHPRCRHAGRRHGRRRDLQLGPLLSALRGRSRSRTQANTSSAGRCWAPGPSRPNGSSSERW